jgi:hypothetical protein
MKLYVLGKCDQTILIDHGLVVKKAHLEKL